MTRLERETMVERYLACEMRADEERTFMMQVATDPELFETLRAYRYMEHSLRGDSNRLLSTSGIDERALNSITSLPLPAATPGRVLGEKLRLLMTRSGAATLCITALVAGTVGYVMHMTVGAPATASSEPPASVQYHSSPAPAQQAPVFTAPKSDTMVALQSTSPAQPEVIKPESHEIEVSTGAPLAASRPRTELPRETTALRTKKGTKATESSNALNKSAVATKPDNPLDPSNVILDTSHKPNTIDIKVTTAKAKVER